MRHVSERTARWLAVAGVLLAAGVAGADQDGPLLIGTDWPHDATAEVKQLFHEAGFNYVRVAGGGYAWSTPRNKSDVEELERSGVKVLLQLGSHYPSADYFRFRDSWLVDQKGESGVEDRNAWAISYSGKNWPQYSYASEEVRRQMEVDFPAYLNELKGFGNVIGLNLHNEPGLHWLTDRIFDYSAPAIHKFRTWLKERYGTIELLNGAWGTAFDSFDSVEPPREEPPVDNLAAWLDWRRANVDFIADFLQWEMALARRTWPGLPMTTNMAGPVDWWHPWRCADNFLFTEGMDVAGIDIYPSEWVPRHFAVYTMDMTAGVAQGRPVHVLECEVYSPQKWPDLTEEQRAAMLRSEIWTYIGHGARGVLLWGLTGRGENDLTRGEYNPRVGAMREITHLCRMLRLGGFHRRKAGIAVVVDPDSYLYFCGKEGPPYFLDKASMGMYGAARDNGYEVDVIFADQVRRRVAEGYKVLLLPCQVMTDGMLAQRVREFVRDGGLLVADAPFAEVDGHGCALESTPGCGLDDVFGVRASEGERAPEMIQAAGWEMSASRLRRNVDPTGADVIGRFADGGAAVTVNRFGRGRAVYVASCVSTSYCDGWGTWARPGLKALVRSLIESHAPSMPRVQVTYEGDACVDVSLLEDSKGNRLIVLTVLCDKGKPISPVSRVEVSLPVDQIEDVREVLALGPPSEADGHVRHLPMPLAVSREGGRATIDVGAVDSAVVVLLAKDMLPTGGLVVPLEVETGSEFSVLAGWRNASPVPVAGTADLILPEGAENLTGPRHIRIEGGGTSDVEFRVRAPDAAERMVVKANLQLAESDAEPFVSVPLDVYVK